jgi:hypothetical protein
MHPRIYDDATNAGTLVGDVRLYDTAHVEDGATVTAMGNAQILLTGDTTIAAGVTITALVGQAQFRYAIIETGDDFRIVRPDGDPYLWTAHRTALHGWVVHAGCVRNIRIADGFDANDVPDEPTPGLTIHRQAMFDTLTELG